MNNWISSSTYLLTAMILSVSAWAEPGKNMSGGIPQLTQEVSELGQRVESLENADPLECPCFDAPMISQYQWQGVNAISSIGFDDEGNTVETFRYLLTSDVDTDGATSNWFRKISPLDVLLELSYSCTFDDIDRPDVTDPSDPSYDPNFPVSVFEENLSLEEHEACNSTMFSLTARRGLPLSVP